MWRALKVAPDIGGDWLNRRMTHEQKPRAPLVRRFVLVLVLESGHAE
jgi:hypothetical protein